MTDNIKFISHNHLISEKNIEKCRIIMDKIKSLSLDESAESQWLSVGFTKVYDVSPLYSCDMSSDFLSSLRERCAFFTGYSLSKLNKFDGSSPVDDTSVLWTNDQEWIINTYKSYTMGIPEKCIYKPPLNLGEAGFDINGVCVNPDTISYQERLTLLYSLGEIDRLERLISPTIIEIGGGYGALAHALAARLENLRYVIIDLPSSLLFSACYLAINAPNLPITVTDDLSSLRHSNFTGFAFVPDYAVKDGELLDADLGINTLSFAEMPESTVDNYARFLYNSLKARNGALFEQNFNTSGHGDTFCDPESIIKRYFDFQIRCRAKTRWGRASLWTTGGRFSDFSWPPGMLGVLKNRGQHQSPEQSP